MVLASTVDQGAEAAAKQKDCGFPFKASILTKDATGGPARSPSLLCMKGLLVEFQELLESVSRRREGGESAFLKDTFICPLKTEQLVPFTGAKLHEEHSLPRVLSLNALHSHARRRAQLTGGKTEAGQDLSK